jgi:Astacin (Peptidase family M12A)
MAVVGLALTVSATGATAEDAIKAIAIEPEIAARPALPCSPTAYPQRIERTVWAANLWPRGVVPYEFASNTTASMQAAARDAMNELETAGNVKFILSTTANNRLRIADSTGNNSFVGTIGGVQTVNVFNWNFKYIICHELMHALGMWHEQSRSDRDLYITVNYANMQAGWGSQYNVIPGAQPFAAFDFDSVMLYSACGASICCPANSSCSCSGANCWTMTALPQYASQQSLMGQRSRLSVGDRAGIANRYGAPCRCAADYDCSGNLTTGDIFAFLNAWFVGDIRTSFNNSGAITTADIFGFLTAWFAGC